MRLLGHFVADDQFYRDLKAAEVFWQLEPIGRMRSYLLENKVAGEKKLKSIESKAKQEIADAIQYASSECKEPSPDTLFKDLYGADEIIY